MHIKSSSGFTLIELLFVIAILGVLSTTSILFYQQKMQNQKIEKTVSQIQQWLQAGIAYRLKKEEWPTNAQVLIDEKFIGASERRNPWCVADDCYEVAVNPTEPDLFHLAVKLNLGGKAVRDAVSARLPYAIKKDDTTLVAVINIPLEGLVKPPHAILIDVRPFHIGPGLDGNALFNLETPPSSHQSNSFATSVTDDPRLRLGKLPSCLHYGAAYSLAMFPTISGYSTRYDTKDSNRRSYFQQAVFSLLEVHAIPSSDYALLQIRARPQRTYYGGCFGRSDCLETNMVSQLMKEIEIRGEVFFVCCKKGTECRKPGTTSTSTSQTEMFPPSPVVTTTPNRVRF
jgi:prepilin-type N-terminal cleavage/methylation domain-containing protein